MKEHITLAAEIMDGALEDGWIAKNPFRSSRLKIIGQESTVVEAFTVDEYHLFEQEILPILPTSAKLFAAITLYTGMRRGEICALRWEDIDFHCSRIHVTKAVSWPGQNRGVIKTPKTKNGVRHPIILPALLPILLQHRQISGYVVRGEREKEDIPITRQGIKRLYERIDRAVKDSGCGVDFRSINRRGHHTIATFMNNAALDEKTIESQLGHYDVRFTRQRYMNAQARQEEKSMAQLAEYIAQI
ncbi:MAG: site-specific integrase [Clostridiales bacterium]|nr:site-specific integrase [Clostridiales bacterium]